MMRIVAPFGFYGWGNIGDEATLNGFARLLRLTGVDAQVSVASRNPRHTALVEPSFRYFRANGPDVRRYWAKLRASVQAVVGGTPIMDRLGKWPLCKLVPLVGAGDRWKTPFYFVGVGIEELREERSRRMLREELAPRVRQWSVRSERDRQRLMEHGVPQDRITVAADLAWLIEPATPEFGRERLQRWRPDGQRPLIAVNLVNENAIFDKHPEMAAGIAQALDVLIKKLGAGILFLANEVREEPCFDTATARAILARMQRKEEAVVLPNDYLSPRQMMSIIGECVLTISMRYHFCLFSALQGVPFIAVERSDKVADLCWDLDWKARILPPDIVPDVVVGEAMRLHESSPKRKQQLSEAVSGLRERALQNKRLLHAMAAQDSDGLAAVFARGAHGRYCP